jgi:hypothetical protein
MRKRGVFAAEYSHVSPLPEMPGAKQNEGRRRVTCDHAWCRNEVEVADVGVGGHDHEDGGLEPCHMEQ